MPKINNLDRHTLFAQRHRHRRENERRRGVPERYASFNSGQPLKRTGSKILSPVICLLMKSVTGQVR